MRHRLKPVCLINPLNSQSASGGFTNRASVLDSRLLSLIRAVLLFLVDSHLPSAVLGRFASLICCHWSIRSSYLLSVVDSHFSSVIIERFVPLVCCSLGDSRLPSAVPMVDSYLPSAVLGRFAPPMCCLRSIRTICCPPIDARRRPASWPW